MQILKKNDKFYCKEGFHVDTITYGETREIIGLSVTDDRGETVFDWKAHVKSADKRESDKKDTVKKQAGRDSTKTTGVKEPFLTKEQLDGLATELQRTGVAMETVQERYHIDDPGQMSEELYNKVMRALSRTRSAA